MRQVYLDYSATTPVKEEVLQAVELAVSMKENRDMPSNVEAYTEENVSVKVIKIIQGYVGIINRMVWRK